VTINDTDATTRAAANHTSGTGQFTMFFRVNGAAVYARGGNKVPMDLLDGRVTADSTRRLVQSAVEGNMNMLRIWGGGIWEPRAFFDAADEFGLLLYTDMQFTWGFIDGSQQDKSEIEYQVKRNSHHPSIAMWDGCNECGGGGLYESFVMPTVAAVDQSRPVWPSCPAPGWTNGVHTLNSLPDNTTLRLGSGGSPRPVPFPFAQEAHGPYTAFMKDSVEGIVMPKAQAQQAVGGTNDPTATPAWTGPGEEGWYRSEFGCVAWSSFESMTAQLPSDQWGMQTPAGVNRNWSPANIINVFFGGRAAAAMSETGEVAFKRQLYQSMVGQALFLKTEIEGWRSQNVFGTTIWMYNEMWPTGGWGSIEYGSTVPGQVSGGRWKPLHYQFRKSTFADQMSTCNTGGACFVTNDAPFPFSGVVSVRLVNVLSGASGIMAQESVSLKPGAGITKWFCATATRNDSVRGVYADHPRQIPTNRDNFTKNIQGTQEQCEAACNADPSCLGFTGAQPVKECWLYSEVATLMNFADADWFQKPGTKPIPAPPTPPPPPPTPSPPRSKVPPPMLPCLPWNTSAVYKSVGCDELGSDCVAIVTVTSAGNQRDVVSENVLPFQPPVSMRLANTTVTTEIAASSSGQNEVTIRVSTSKALALFVVLTTLADGRFSDNFFLLEAGTPKNVSFLSWGPLDEAKMTLLRASLRVEHLAEYL